MEYRIAETFTDSLTNLTGEEQKAVKTTAFDLQLNPANLGMQFHKLDRAKDKRFWSVRVNSDIRLIVHRSSTSLLLCYVGRHDDAYAWAERRKLETHPKTGAAQIVEIKESIKEVVIPIYTYVEKQDEKEKLFIDISKEDLLGYGVPEEWVEDVQNADEDTILNIAEHLPAEAAEALLNIAVGAIPETVIALDVNADPFEHPDAQRRFRVMNNVEELERALDYPWEKWTIFLHPTQKSLVEGHYNGPARISGSAGTGKTIVALHRAVFLARENPDARVLITTFSDTLANALISKLKILIFNEPRIMDRIEVHSLDSIAKRLYEYNFGKPQIITDDELKLLIEEHADKTPDIKFSYPFLINEWMNIVDAWQLKEWDEYRTILRVGRKTRLTEKQRTILWSVFEQVRASLTEKNLTTTSQLYAELSNLYANKDHGPFDFIVVDEAQDISVPQLRFLAALGKDRDNSLFFTGDLGQRIFQHPFSWKSLGIDIRGRSRTLRINYRTSHQIRMQADLLLGSEITDVDGNKELRGGTISVFNGPRPTITVFETEDKEIKSVGDWLVERINEGFQPHELGVFVRSDKELPRAIAAVKKARLNYLVLDDKVDSADGVVSISTMHFAKGLEFKAVSVMACDDEVIPLQERIEAVADYMDLEDIYNTERHLLYVACTRAREHLLVSGVEPASEFLDDLRSLPDR